MARQNVIGGGTPARRQYSPRKCLCGCGQHPRSFYADYVRGHRPPSEDAACRDRCSVDDCTSVVGPKGARGLCSRHYQRLLSTGSPTGTRREPAIDRFMRNVKQVDDCWEWTAGKDGCGYGMFSDRATHRWVSRSHRWAYEYFITEIPAGLDLDHLCRNRACVNPWHLEPVTNLVNVKRGAEARRRNECRNGHLYDDANTYINPAGRRVCRTCAQQGRIRYEQKKAA